MNTKKVQHPLMRLLYFFLLFLLLILIFNSPSILMDLTGRAPADSSPTFVALQIYQALATVIAALISYVVIVRRLENAR